MNDIKNQEAKTGNTQQEDRTGQYNNTRMKQNRQTVRDRGEDKDLNKGKGVIT